jgi:hypothetical protein
MPSALPGPSVLAGLTRFYGLDTINQKQQRALFLLAKIYELKDDANQTDYTVAGGFRQLSQDAQTATIGMTPDQVHAAQVGEAWAVAAAVAGAPATLAAQLAQLGLLVEMTDDQLDRMDLLIEYLLQQATGD